jgi:hypothetical protein
VRVAYFDIAGLGDKADKVAVAAAVVLRPDTQWRSLDSMRHSILFNENLTARERANFEFHASKLFRPKPDEFVKWGQEKRFRMLRQFLDWIPGMGLHVFYGAVNRADLESYLLRKDPRTKRDELNYRTQEYTFLKCLGAVARWVCDDVIDEMVLCLADDTDVEGRRREGRPKILIKEGLRFWRNRAPFLGIIALAHVMDTVYFGASDDSLGIQLADSCSYFIKRHLMGKKDSEAFYRIIERKIHKDCLNAPLKVGI